ncbi:MAG: L,D-transpeptidase family protein, partial [Gammaproteobacteria bacterium]|nr:L,D-transpeptidase family protein [Gammaproteobacteria bacterium]
AFVLSDNNFPYRLRQDPGPKNSLGQLKFNFPNSHDVYLHDTPSQSLLDLSYRTLSSGCVRLAQPLALAEWLVSNSDGDRIEQALSDPKYMTKGFKPTRTIPIHIVYILAWVSLDDGSIQFRNDMYRKLEQPKEKPRNDKSADQPQ